MHISVFGATGGTGRELVSQAAAAGHHVQALTRSLSKLPGEEAIVAVEGNVLDPAHVAASVTGVDAVVCLLGRTENNPSDVVSRGTAHIIDAMHQYEVRRLVVLTSIGLGSSVRNLPWYGRVLNATLLNDLMADKARQEELVMSSSLDWTVVRPGGLTDAPPTGDYVHGVDAAARAAPIARADVADFLLEVTTGPLYVRKTPIVTTRQKPDAAFLWEQATGVADRLVRGK